MNNSNRGLLNSAINLIFRDAKIIITVWGVCVLVAVIAILLSSKSYEAKSTLLVQFSREYIYRSETGDQRSIVPRTGMEEALNSEVQILASRDLKERVISAIGIDRLYPDVVDSATPLDDALENIGEAFTIRTIEESNIINLYFQHESPELAAETLNKLVDLFKIKRLDVYRDSDVSFFQGQVTELTAELRKIESGFVSFKAENRVFDLLEQTNLLVERHNRLSGELDDAEIAVNELQERRVALTRQMSQTPKTIDSFEANEGQITDEARSRLFALRLEEKQLLELYTEDFDAVKDVRNQIEQLEQFISSQEENVSGQKVRTDPNQVYQTLEAEQLRVETELTAMEARRNAISLQLKEVESEINRLAALQSEYDKMEREVESIRRALQVQLSNLSDAQAFDALDSQNKTNIRVVQSAVPPAQAIGASRKTKALLSVPIGLLAGLLVAFCLNLLRSTVSEAVIVERQGRLPVLATIDRSD